MSLNTIQHLDKIKKPSDIRSYINGIDISNDKQKVNIHPIYHGIIELAVKIVDDETFNGDYESYHDNGRLWEKVNYINGNKHGIYSSFHDNGQLEEEVNYIDGLRQGIYKSYYSNGKLFEEVNYIDGLKQGIYKSYHPNGQLKEEVNYINGEMN
jgi:antitoxin component YwqK of YwqJK toxin-antitoxin module